MGELAGLIAILCVFSIPLSAIWSTHRRKMIELQFQMGRGDDATVRAAVEALREEVRTLRDTTMQYDISFDSALQRMETRVGQIERRVGTVAQPERIAELTNSR